MLCPYVKQGNNANLASKIGTNGEEMSDDGDAEQYVDDQYLAGVNHNWTLGPTK